MNTFKRLSLAGLSVLLGTCIADAQQYMDNALYVKFKESAKISAKSFNRDVVPLSSLGLRITKAKNDKFGLHQEAQSMSLLDNPVLDKTFQIRFDSTDQIDKLIRTLENDPNVEYVEKVPIYELYGTYPENAKDDEAKASPTDPYYQPIDGIHYQWYLDMIDAEGAWELQQGDPDIIAAVVDGSIWGEHPELNIPSERQYNAGTGVEGNSAPPSSVNQDQTCETLYSEDPNYDPCPAYTWSHGTHCAGVVGAANDNGEGIASLASGVTLLGVAAHLPQYSNSVYNGYGGIRWAVQEGARVINCSWGGGYNSATETELLKSCYENGIVVVAAAGNDNSSEPQAPAMSEYVISVGSVDESGGKSSFSNYGTWVSITAPGGYGTSSNGRVGIFSTTFCKSQYLRLYHQDNQFDDVHYDVMTGTSMAAPVVSSLCALMLSRNPDLTVGEIKDILQNTSEFRNANRAYFSPLAGTINAAAAIRAVDEMRYDAPVQNLIVEDFRMDTAWISWERPTGNTHEILSYNIFRNGILLDSTIAPDVTSYMDTAIEGGFTSYMVSVNYSDNYKSVRQETREDIPELFDISVICTPANAGTVTGTGRYPNRATASLRAIPDSGYVFNYWYGQGEILSTRDYYQFRVTGDRTINAVFATAPSANEMNELAQATVIDPNPVHDVLNITTPARMEKLQILNIQGQLVQEIETGLSDKVQIETGNLETGTYILNIHTQDGLIQKKFVKL